MKKIIIMSCILVLVASSSFAADIASGATGDMTFATVGGQLHAAATGSAAKTTPQIGKTSTGVSVGWNTNVNGYALVTQHKSGTKAYGSSYDSTALFQSTADGTPGTVILAKPTGTDTQSFTGTGWKTM